MRSHVAALLCLLAAAGAVAADDAAGYWEGAIAVPGLELKVAVTLRHDAGRWTGTIDLTEQGLRSLPLSGIEVGDGREVRFGIPGVPGAPLFDGKLSGDGAAISGDFVQHGEPFPFELVRAEEPAEDGGDPFRDFSGPGATGRGFAGTWNGILSSGPAKLRMSLVLETGENGALGGRLHSVDQRQARLDITGVARLDDKLIVEVESIGAVLNVQLTADGTELAGRWEQEMAGIDLPLELFRRPR